MCVLAAGSPADEMRVLGSMPFELVELGLTGAEAFMSEGDVKRDAGGAAPHDEMGERLAADSAAVTPEA